MDRYSFSYDQIHEQVEVGRFGEEGGEEQGWAPIPEEPRSPGEMLEDHYDVDRIQEEYHDEYNEEEERQEQVIGQSSSEAPTEQRTQSQSASSSLDIRTVGPNRTASTATPTSSSNINNQSPSYIPLNQSYTSPTSIQSEYTRLAKSQSSHESEIDYQKIRISTTTNNNNNKSNQFPILQPDAIYEEHYGDAYVDQLIKYLYPAGYQSMRPRSGPWKLSILIFGLFMWLSVFIVGHCYDRGQEYNTYFGRADDAYLQDVDDDTLVMETRWCGSKLIYAMWFVCVSITILALSYCSIIGYIKLRDVAVANGRSQPPGMTSDGGGAPTTTGGGAVRGSAASGGAVAGGAVAGGGVGGGIVGGGGDPNSGSGLS